MIELTDKTIAIWFLQLSLDSDLMMSIWEDEEGKIVGRSRFRYYKDEKAFDSQDEKKWYSFHTKDGATKDEVIEGCREIMGAMSEAAGHSYDEIMATSAEEYANILSTKPWAHMHMVKNDKEGKDDSL